MLHNKQTAKLFVDGREFDVHIVEMFVNLGNRCPSHFTIKATEIVETTKPFPDFVAKRQELIDFAKNGAPPEQEYEHGKHYVYDATSQTFDEALVQPALPAFVEIAAAEGPICDHVWVDQSPTYSAVLAARDQGKSTTLPTRCVPRMFYQKPYGQFECHCHRELGDKFYGTRGCFLGKCDQGKATRPTSLNDFARDFHASNQRWWTDLTTGVKLDRNMGEMLMLVVSEIAECMEGERKNLMDDHLPHRKMAEVELADAVIRLADIAGSRNLDIEYKWSGSTEVDENKGEALLLLVWSVLRTAEASVKPHDRLRFARKLSLAIHRIERYAEKHGYDLWGAVFEKMEYNKTRADHTPEARKAANGKKF